MRRSYNGLGLRLDRLVTCETKCDDPLRETPRREICLHLRGLLEGVISAYGPVTVMVTVALED